MNFASTALPLTFRPSNLTGELVRSYERARHYGMNDFAEVPLAGFEKDAMIVVQDDSTAETWIIDGRAVEAWIPGYNGKADERGIWMLQLDRAPNVEEARQILAALIDLRRLRINPGLDLVGSC